MGKRSFSLWTITLLGRGPDNSRYLESQVRECACSENFTDCCIYSEPYTYVGFQFLAVRMRIAWLILGRV